jgi:hypothetical protein
MQGAFKFLQSVERKDLLMGELKKYRSFPNVVVRALIAEELSYCQLIGSSLHVI